MCVFADKVVKINFLDTVFLAGLKTTAIISHRSAKSCPRQCLLFNLLQVTKYAAAAATVVLMNMKPESQKCFTIDDIKLSDSSSAVQPGRFFKGWKKGPGNSIVVVTRVCRFRRPTTLSSQKVGWFEVMFEVFGECVLCGMNIS